MLEENAEKLFACAKLFVRCGTFYTLVSVKPWRVITRFFFVFGLVEEKKLLMNAQHH